MPSQNYTVTKTTGWFERLGNSFGGIIFGIVLFIVGSILLWWNEGNFVKTQVALNEAQGVTQELGDITQTDSANNGKLVHATGTATTEDILKDPDFDISTNALRLERAVEYYQWIEDSKTETRQKLGGGEEKITTYIYRKDWVTSPVDSARFAAPNASTEHQNSIIANIKKFDVQAVNVNFGAYRLPKFLIDSISGSEPLSVKLSDEVITKLTQQIAPSAALPVLPASAPDKPAQGLLPFDEEKKDEQSVVSAVAAPPSSVVHVSGGTVYLGQTPAQPAVGDVRVTFKQTKSRNEVSLVAKLNGDTFEQFVAKNGRNISMLNMGTVSAENMFASAHASNTMLTWILRLVGVCLVCFGIALILAPLEVLASVIPFVGKIVGIGTGLFSMFFGTAWSLLIIATAWLFYRPLIGIILLAAAALLIAALYSKRRVGKDGKDTNAG